MVLSYNAYRLTPILSLWLLVQMREIHISRYSQIHPQLMGVYFEIWTFIWFIDRKRSITIILPMYCKSWLKKRNDPSVWPAWIYSRHHRTVNKQRTVNSRLLSDCRCLCLLSFLCTIQETYSPATGSVESTTFLVWWNSTSSISLRLIPLLVRIIQQPSGILATCMKCWGLAVCLEWAQFMKRPKASVYHSSGGFSQMHVPLLPVPE